MQIAGEAAEPARRFLIPIRWYCNVNLLCSNVDASRNRHAHAFGLFPKRGRNVRAALEKIIERAGEVDVTAPAVVAAVQAYSKINAAGQWVERREHVDLNELFEKMSREELEGYAQSGTLPAWFTGTLGATAGDSHEE